MFTTKILVVLVSPTAGSLHIWKVKEQRPYRRFEPDLKP